MDEEIIAQLHDEALEIEDKLDFLNEYQMGLVQEYVEVQMKLESYSNA
jgi:hypothetical protein